MTPAITSLPLLLLKSPLIKPTLASSILRALCPHTGSGPFEARRGTRVVRLTSARRNVYTYESEVAKNGGLGSIQKRLGLPTGAVPATPSAEANEVKDTNVNVRRLKRRRMYMLAHLVFQSSYLSLAGSASPYGDYMGGPPLSSTPSLTTSEGDDDQFKSLTDLEPLAFDEEGVQDKLKFDLGESLRSGRWLDEGFRFPLDNPLRVGASAHPLNEKEIKERHAEPSKMMIQREKGNARMVLWGDSTVLMSLSVAPAFGTRTF
ncbi:uncharacterized protein SCHCODRAFT_02671583 [Schizophyllum commune H4-8]|nr:uncharacterized protein SCHCODRAFT_02671583 [Schizophyllum commune H4-8]KAI5887586.1 hypothetical protein SCHCODRAFT_02671583 [Schizophyllum commune H4-8]